MTFDLSLAEEALRAGTTEVAARLHAAAADVDRRGEIAPELTGAVTTLLTGEWLSDVLVVEGAARGSAAVALSSFGARSTAEPLGLGGLRGAKSVVDHSPRSQLLLAAVALGIGSTALAACVREAQREPTGRVERPQWVMADVATALEAARWLTYRAASTAAVGDIALARLLATQSASAAVDAALRMIGAAAMAEGSVLERLARDVRALALIAGGEDEQRAVAADEMYGKAGATRR